MQPLEKDFRHGGFEYHQLKRHGNTAVYEQRKGGVVVAYEVILIRVKAAHTFPNGITTPKREGYPSNEEWGKYAWTCSSLERANQRWFGLQNGPDFKESVE